MNYFIHFRSRQFGHFYWIMGVAETGTLNCTSLLEEAKAYTEIEVMVVCQFMRDHYSHECANIHVHTEEEMLKRGDMPDKIKKLLKIKK